MKRAEADLFEQAVLDINVSAKQERLADKDGLYISAVATVINKGNRNAFLDFRPSPPFSVLRMGFDEEGRGEPETGVTVKAQTDYMTLRRGASEQFPLLVRVPKPGFYLIYFEVRLSNVELQVHEATAHDSSMRSGPIVWSGQTYVAVR